MSITAQLPKRAERKIVVHVAVDAELHEEVRSALSVNELSWREFMEASMRAYLEEQKGKRK